MGLTLLRVIHNKRVVWWIFTLMSKTIQHLLSFEIKRIASLKLNNLKMILIILPSILLSGCFEDETKDIDNAAEHIQNAAENLSRGLNSLDPIGLKTLVKDNARLKLLLDDTNQLLSSFSNDSASIVLKGQKLRFEVVHYTGSFRIDSWIDKESNWFWKNRRISNLDQELRLQSGNEVMGSAKPPIPMNVKLGITGNSIASIIDSYRTQVQVAFKEYLKQAYPLPAPDERVADLNQNLITLGMHKVYFRVTPLANNVTGRWSFRGRLSAQMPNGETLSLKEFDLDDSLYPTQQMKQPLPDIIALISVKNKM